MEVRESTLTLDDFARLYEQDGPFEIVDGERIPLMPPVAGHGYLIRTLLFLLQGFVSQRGLGEVFSELPFVLTYDSEWVRGARVPDLMFFAADRWQAYIAATPDWRKKPFVLVPDLVVEVVSANDRFSNIQSKVDRYLGDGVRMVWVIDPERERVQTYTVDQYATLTTADHLRAKGVIDGLEIPVAQIFA